MKEPILIFSPATEQLVVCTEKHATKIKGFLKGEDGLHQAVIKRRTQIKLIHQLIDCLYKAEGGT